MVQTSASAGESLVAGIIFTVPALVMMGAWGGYHYWPIVVIGLIGEFSEWPLLSRFAGH